VLFLFHARIAMPPYDKILPYRKNNKSTRTVGIRALYVITVIMRSHHYILTPLLLSHHTIIIPNVFGTIIIIIIIIIIIVVVVLVLVLVIPRGAFVCKTKSPSASPNQLLNRELEGDYLWFTRNGASFSGQHPKGSS
jgi:hypothetical protein